MAMLSRSLLLFSAVALSGCLAMQIRSDYDPAAKLDGLQSYDWIEIEKKPSADPRLSDPMLDKRIRQLVEKQLATQGYVRSTVGAPDFIVGYHVALEKKLAVSTMNDYYGYRAGWGWSYGAGTGRVVPESYVYQYEQGSLIIDIVNPQTRELMWRGAAQAEVSQKKRNEQLAEAVQRILERFPPQQKK